MHERSLRVLATAFIYVPPCERLICQALCICQEVQGGNTFRLLIRVDDRLTASCCSSDKEYDRLVSLSGNLSKIGLFKKHFDQMWLEQRIHEIEEEGSLPNLVVDPAGRFRHSYLEESYSPWDIIAAIIHVGEETQIRAMMTSESFPQRAHVPSATEMYCVYRETSSSSTARHFLGKYPRNKRLVRRQDLDLAPPPESGSDPTISPVIEPSDIAL